MRRIVAAIAVSALLGNGGLSAQPGRVPASRAAPPSAAAVPYQRWVLPNGLTLIVHEDRKAPIVAVTVAYNVSAVNETPGKRGIAHLYEHLFARPTQHNKEKYADSLTPLGVTGINAEVNYDRTLTVQTAPKEALDTVLWAEAERMGFLANSIDQAALDAERGIIKNEWKEREGQPFGGLDAVTARALYPTDHPYRNTTIRSTAELDAITLEDIRKFYENWYRPSNAVVSVAGDVAAAEVKAKVEKYFGTLPPGPPTAFPHAWTVELDGVREDVVYERGTGSRIDRIWHLPPANHADIDYLELVPDILSQDADSPLYKRLVEVDKSATSLGVFVWRGRLTSQFLVQVNAKSAEDLDRIERAVAEELEKLATAGPTVPQLRKSKMAQLAQRVQGTERVGGFQGKAALLAHNQLLYGQPTAWKVSLERMQAAQPNDVRDAVRRWLRKNAYTLKVLPFGRPSAAPGNFDRSVKPRPGPIAPARFPEVQRVTLSNGLPILFVPRPASAQVRLQMLVNTDPVDPNTSALAAALLREGTATRDRKRLAEEIALTGSITQTSATAESATVTMASLRENLPAAVDIFADMVRRPRFDPDDIERVKAQRATRIRTAKNDPTQSAFRLLPKLAFGPSHPYAQLETEEGLAAIGRDQLARYHDRWFKPGRATLIVVGGTTLSELRPLLEKSFAGWKGGTDESVDVPPIPAPPETPTLYFVDRPGARQTTILAGIPLPRRSPDVDQAVWALQLISGASFPTGRLWSNIRVEKGWAYGVYGDWVDYRGSRMLMITAPVQTDKAVDAFKEIQRELGDIVASKPVTREELARFKDYQLASLAAAWETNAGVGAPLSVEMFSRLPSNYTASTAQRFSTLDLDSLRRTAEQLFQPRYWIMIGDRSAVGPSLDQLGMKVEFLPETAIP